MLLVQDQSQGLLTSSPACYHCIMDAHLKVVKEYLCSMYSYWFLATIDLHWKGLPTWPWPLEMKDAYYYVFILPVLKGTCWLFRYINPSCLYGTFTFYLYRCVPLSCKLFVLFAPTFVQSTKPTGNLKTLYKYYYYLLFCRQNYPISFWRRYFCYLLTAHDCYF